MNASASSIIDVRSLRIWYGSVHAVKGVSASIERNKITALIGASGSGKSSFLRCMNRMLDHADCRAGSGSPSSKQRACFLACTFARRTIA